MTTTGAAVAPRKPTQARGAGAVTGQVVDRDVMSRQVGAVDLDSHDA